MLQWRRLKIANYKRLYGVYLFVHLIELEFQFKEEFVEETSEKVFK